MATTASPIQVPKNGTADGELLRASATGDLNEGEQLGRALAAELLDLGAGVLSGPEM